MKSVTRTMLVMITLIGICSSVQATPILVPGMPGDSGIVATSEQKAVAIGFQALVDNNIGRAESAFNGVLKASPQNTSAMLGMAEISLRRDDTETALDWLTRARRLAPDSADVQTAFGRVRFRQNRHDEAIASYRRAIELDPSTFLARMDLGDLYLGTLNRPEDAIASYREAVAVEPDYPVARFALGMAYLRADRAADAIEAIGEAARLAPTDPTLPHAIGRIHASRQDFTLAVEAFNRALAVSPSFLPALLDRGDVYAEIEQNGAAAGDYEQALARKPEDSVTRLKVGMVYQRLGRIDQAVAAYHAALAGNPGFAPAYNNLAMIEVRRDGDLAQALNWARRAVELAPQVPQFRDTLGAVYEASGDTANALDALESAVGLPPPQAEILFRLGRVYEQSDRPGQAVDAYQKALSVEPEFANADAARARLAALE